MSSVSQGSNFEKEVEQLLRLKGYVVTRNNLLNGTQIDLLASKTDPLDNTKWIVECADRQAPIGVDLVKEKASTLLSLQGAKAYYRLMFVSRHGFTAEAKAFEESQPHLKLLTLNQLENLLVDLTPYVDWYIHNYENSLGFFKEASLHSNYVPLSARDDAGELILSLDQRVHQWLEEDESNLLFILGDYGAGKTSFCRHFAYTLLRAKYFDHAPQRFTPILVNLRDIRGKLDLRRVLIESLEHLHGVQLPTFGAFEKLCSTGSILLLLDGFDEMSDRSDAQALIDAFSQIYVFATLSAKVILTCRSNFFKSHADLIDLLRRFSITIPFEDEKKLVELSLGEQGKLLYVEKLNNVQVRQFVEKRFSARTEEMLSIINGIHDLSDLSTRPVLLDMILSTLPKLEQAKRKINSAALYAHYTDQWTNRDQWRVSLPLKIRQSFCEVLAWALHCADISGVPYALLERLMVNSLESVAQSPEQLEKFKNDIQTCSFLVKVGENEEFRFAHKSFREYFVARKLVADLTAGSRVEKADAALLATEKSEDQLLFDRLILTSHFGSGKATMWGHCYSVLSDRLKSSRVFASMQEAEIARAWSLISSDASMRSHFEMEVAAIFSKQWVTSFSEDIVISEEIATFAIEQLINSNVDCETFVERIADERSFDVFSDIVRLAKAPEWVHKNEKMLRDYSIRGANRNLRIASASAIGRFLDCSVEYLRATRTSLPGEGWSYLLFEVANSRREQEAALTTLLREDDLSSVDQIICIYGLGGVLPGGETNERLVSLVSELLRSPSAKERSLAVQVCSSLPQERRVKVIAQAFTKADTSSLKKALVKILEDLADVDAWKTFRALAAQEQDPETRANLRDAEKMLLDVRSRKRERNGWDRISGSRAIREKLWKG